MKSEGLPPEFVLFGEDASRVLVSCAAENLQKLREIAVEYGVAVVSIGETVSGTLEIAIDGAVAASAPINDVYPIWAGALERALREESGEGVVSACGSPVSR
jgi:phosphoribosylformylglycinamidine synthase